MDTLSDHIFDKVAYAMQRTLFALKTPPTPNTSGSNDPLCRTKRTIAHEQCKNPMTG